jgi:hypothetical protein
MAFVCRICGLKFESKPEGEVLGRPTVAGILIRLGGRNGNVHEIREQREITFGTFVKPEPAAPTKS